MSSANNEKIFFPDEQQKVIDPSQDTQSQLLKKLLHLQRDIAIAGLNIDRVMNLIVDRLLELFPTSGAVVEIVEGHEMVYRAASGGVASHLGMRLSMYSSFSGYCVITRKVQYCPDSELDNRVDREACRKVGVRSMIVVPLFNRGSPVGVLKILSPRVNAFSKEDIQVLEMITEVLSAAISYAAEFKEKTDALQKAIQIRDEFISIASHELKTPITSLKLRAEILAKRTALHEVYRPPGNAVDQLIETTTRQLNRITRLIDNMLDVSEITAGHLNYSYQTVEISELIESVSRSIIKKFKALDSKLIITVNSPIFVRADPRRLEQVFDNIMTNAFNYGSGKPIQIAVFRENNTAKILIKDQGIGIASENLERIFNRFERAVSVKNISGFGLELYLSRQIIESHQGRIWAESEIGKGSTFFIELPLIDSNENKDI